MLFERGDLVILRGDYVTHCLVIDCGTKELDQSCMGGYNYFVVLFSLRLFKTGIRLSYDSIEKMVTRENEIRIKSHGISNAMTVYRQGQLIAGEP